MPLLLSFRSKIISSYIFIVVISFAFVAFFLDRNLEKNSLQEIKSSLLVQAELIASQIPAKDIQERDTASLTYLADALKPKLHSRMTIINTLGEVLADSERPARDISAMENHLNRPEVRSALSGLTGIETRYSSTLKIDMLYLAVPVKNKDGIIGVLRLALPLEGVQKTLFGIRRIVFWGLLFAMGLAFLLGSVVAGNIIHPVNRMIEVSRKFSQGDFSRRIILDSKDEIGGLAQTLNSMAQDIEDKISEIKEQNQKLSATFNSMIEGVIVTDKSGRIVSINPTIEKIFGVSNTQAKGKIFLEAVRNNDISEVIGSVLKEGEARAAEINLLLPVRRIFQINAAPIYDNQGVSGTLVVIHDITEIRRLETMRRDFVANVSHELKTPLTSIKGFVETLLAGALDDKENNRAFLTIIQDHAERLDKLVDDLLALSQLESKEIAIEKEDLNLRQEVETVIRGFQAQLKNKGVELRNELPAGLVLKADRGRLEQVFTNLIDNAIKFNKEHGSIRIYSQDTGSQVKVTVEDSGIGIPEKDIPRIFERFYRVDKSRSRELGGTGLGLSIVRHIVELHGGNTGVESSEGLGSKFFFILPK